MAEYGIDFAYGSGLTVAEIKAAKKSFVCRYLSGGGSKDISKAELDNYEAGGIRVILVWETSGQEFSESQGASDARAAQAELNQLGAGSAVVFFAQDIPVDTSIADQIAYTKGVNSVLGFARTGGYGDYATIKALFDAGVIKFGWQTYGGSNGEWDDRALLRQYLNAQKVGPAQVDLDEAAYFASSTKVLTMDDDFGQWPRPKGGGSTPPPPPPAAGLQRHVVPAGNGYTLVGLARERNTTTKHIIDTSRVNLDPKNLEIFNLYVALLWAMQAAKLPLPAMPEGLVYYTDGG